MKISQKELLEVEAKIMKLLRIDSNEYYLTRNNNAYDYVVNNSTQFLAAIKKEIAEPHDFLNGKFESILLATTNSKHFWLWWGTEYHIVNIEFLEKMNFVLTQFPEFPSTFLLPLYNETQSKNKVFPSRKIIKGACEHIHASLKLLNVAENILANSIFEPLEAINSLIKEKGLDGLSNDLAFAFSNGRTHDLYMLSENEKMNLKNDLEKINQQSSNV